MGARDPDEERRQLEWSLICQRLAEIQRDLVGRVGLVVQGGPFRGMALTGRSCGSLFLPKLLGTYESELHPVWEHLRGEPFERVVNVGCGEGYYAVGLARMFPGAAVHAYDLDEAAQEETRRGAALNGAAARVSVGGEFSLASGRALCAGRALVVCDIEGAEFDVLDPTAAAHAGALDDADLVIELHKDWLIRPFLEKFAPTHEAERIDTGDAGVPVPACLRHRPQYEQLLAMCEFRGGPTPWLFLRSRRHL